MPQESLEQCCGSSSRGDWKKKKLESFLQVIFWRSLTPENKYSKNVREFLLTDT